MDFSFGTLFGAGLLTFFTPCVLPMIPVYFAAMTGGSLSQNKKGTLFVRSIFFSLGFILVFTLMGAAASSIGSLVRVYQHYIMLGGGILILLFGLKFVHFIHIPLFDRIARVDDSKLSVKFGPLNAFIFGVVFAAGWSPCIGPILGSVLTWTASSAENATEGMLYLALYGAGFATPFLLTAAFAEKGIAFIRKSGSKLLLFEKITGILLIAASLYMIALSQTMQQPIPGSITKPSDILFVNHDHPVLVEFYRDNCPVCKGMEPVVNEIFQKCDGKNVALRKINLSKPENKGFVSEYRILGVPTFVLFDKSGNEQSRLIGHQETDNIYRAIALLRGEQCEGVGALPEGLNLSEGASCGSKDSENETTPSCE
ncbi:sulfite exporter TauE/SafE family protein [bacterium]|nr:sulfite exporter TauE/SafE family protein [bacterium]